MTSSSLLGLWAATRVLLLSRTVGLARFDSQHDDLSGLARRKVSGPFWLQAWGSDQVEEGRPRLGSGRFAREGAVTHDGRAAGERLAVRRSVMPEEAFRHQVWSRLERSLTAAGAIED